MANPRREPKIDHIPAEAFQGISPQAKRKLCVGAVARAPGFVMEIAKGMPAGFLFETGLSERSIIEQAFACKSIALARWALRRLAKDPASVPWRMPEHSALFQIALKSTASDRQVERLGQWARAAFEAIDLDRARQSKNARRQEASTAQRLAREAGQAFAHGRPALGALLCEQLLALGPEQAAQGAPNHSRSESHHQVEGVLFPKLVWLDDGSLNASAWREGLKWPDREMRSFDSRPRDKEQSVENFANLPLPALARLWSNSLAEDGSELARALSARVKEVGDQLWAAGSLSTPSDFQRRFEAAPDEKDSDALARRRAALASLTPSQAQLLTSDLWIHAAAEPAFKTGPAQEPLWDAFCSRFQGAVEGVDPNPFIPFGNGSCPALWSLALGGRLIEMALDRGLDPAPIDRLAARQGALGASIVSRSKKIISGPGWAPTWTELASWNNAWQKTRSIGTLNLQAIGSAPRARAAKEGTTLSPAEESSFSSQPVWVRANVSSLAMIAGLPLIAQRLVQAGCLPPSCATAIQEARASNVPIDKVGTLESHWNAFEIALALRSGKGRKAPPPEPPSAPSKLRL
jgi:hypothetical protein